MTGKAKGGKAPASGGAAARSVAECVMGLSSMKDGDAGFREAVENLAGTFLHGDCGALAREDRRLEGLDLEKLKGLVSKIRAEEKEAKKKKAEAETKAKGGLEEGKEIIIPVDQGLKNEVSTLSSFGSPEWSVALYFLYPRQVHGLYEDSRKRLSIVCSHLTKTLYGLEEAIGMMMVGAVAQEPVLLLGPPGSGKTRAAVEFFEALGLGEGRQDPGGEGGKTARDGRKMGGFFHYLLTRLTTPEEICGPFSIPAMYRGKMLRNDTGMLTGPGIRAAFIDEIFKAGSGLLHGILTLLSDRAFHSEGRLLPADLAVIVMAANDPPGENELAAVYDRMSLRLYFPDISLDPGKSEDSMDGEPGFLHVVERAWRKEGFQLDTSYGNLEGMARSCGASDLYDLAKKRRERGLWTAEAPACINDVLLLTRALCLAPFDRRDPKRPFLDMAPTEAFFQGFTTMVRELHSFQANCRLSGRKLKALYKLARARALLRKEGPPLPDVEDLVVFKHVWEVPEARDELAAEVDTLMDKVSEREQ